MRYDVAVIGGGPAGAWCATRLAAAGARVVLVDGSHPREKPCGGGVTGRALKLVGACPDPAVAVSVESAAFDFEGRRVEMPLTSDLTRPRLAVFPRRDFDAMLVERARTEGVTLLEERAISLSSNEPGWTVATRGARGGTEITARWLVGADGANSLVRKRVARAFDREDLSIACGYFVHGVSGTRIDIRFEDAPAGYLWSFPRPDHLAIGICAQADASSVASLMPIADRWIRDNVTGGTPTRYSWPIPSLCVDALERERPAADSWILIGDAAGLVDPITREGIYFALESAEAAAASLAGVDAAQQYTSRLRDTTYAELTIAAKIKARFYRGTFMRLLINALERSERIRTIMLDLVAGEQPYSTLRRRLLATLEWKLASELFLRRR